MEGSNSLSWLKDNLSPLANNVRRILYRVFSEIISKSFLNRSNFPVDSKLSHPFNLKLRFHSSLRRKNKNSYLYLTQMILSQFNLIYNNLLQELISYLITIFNAKNGTFT